MAVCRRIVPRDAYEWTHVFECLLRAGELSALDMNSFRPGRPASRGRAGMSWPVCGCWPTTAAVRPRNPEWTWPSFTRMCWMATNRADSPGSER